jgi:hypothetical protein
MTRSSPSGTDCRASNICWRCFAPIPLQNDDVLRKLREAVRNRLEVVLALGDHDWGSPGFESREDVIKNHVITGHVARQKTVDLLNRARRIGFPPLDTECGLLDHGPVQGRVCRKDDADVLNADALLSLGRIGRRSACALAPPWLGPGDAAMCTRVPAHAVGFGAAYYAKVRWVREEWGDENYRS